MAVDRKDSVADATTTVGTGTLTLTGISPIGFRPFSNNITDGATVRYRVSSLDLTEWEDNSGVWDNTAKTLTRGVPSTSSNAGNLVSFSAGTKFVTHCISVADFTDKEDVVNKDASGGYVGKTLEKLDIYNPARTFLNFLVAEATTAARTWTLPNETGTLALRSNTKLPTVAIYTSGSGTYTKPADVTGLIVKVLGAGGGGAGYGAGGTGGTTTFGAISTTGGGGGGNAFAFGGQSPAGGAASGGTINIPGMRAANLPGNTAPIVYQGYGGNGANSQLGCGGLGATNGNNQNGGNATGYGSGGGGVGGGASTMASCGGSAGGYAETYITSPATSYSYAVGAAGTGGASGETWGTGGNGAPGIIIIEEYYG